MSSEATQILSAISAGDRSDADRLMQITYKDFRRLAKSYLGDETRSNTLQPTAVVHEAFIKLVNQEEVDWRGRSHFFAVGAIAMRQILVDHSRETSRNKTDALGRFATEARIAAKLQHPGIAPVHDVGRLVDGRAFLAMKLVKGETMASRFSARIDPADNRAELLAVFEHLCQTIAYAHANDIIHRDLKPDNVMVGEFGEVQVMDWGLAKEVLDSRCEEPVVSEGDRICGPQTSPSKTPSSGSETRLGAIMGTPASMPPEQAAGKRGKPTDVFSLPSRFGPSAARRNKLACCIPKIEAI